ncbi:DegV family protein [Desulfococcaceae bacterium HSG8]|nr:DegV family protein [Desulfococcaceae bacterium HSG8]
MKTKVLIVDDEPIIGNLLEGGLSEAGFEAEYFDSSVRALENIQQVRPDIIISDISMPHMDGYELRRRLRQDPGTAAIPFIFLSARTDVPDQLEGLRMGADDYVCKPFKIENLISRVENVMERAAKARSLQGQTDFGGDLGRISFNDVMQIVGSNQKTGELVFSNSENGRNGKVFFLKGRLVNALMDPLEGEEAFYELMGEDEGYLEFHSKMIDVPEKITDDNMTVLIRGSRMADKSKSLYRRLPDIDIILNNSSPETPPVIEEESDREHIENILSMIRKRKTVRDIISSGGISRIRAASLLTSLLDIGAVAVQEETTRPQPKSGAKPKATPPKIRRGEDGFSPELSMIEEGFLKVLKSFDRGALTGVLEIRGRPEKAAIYFQDGRIVHAYQGRVIAKKALYRIFSEKGGTFKFRLQPVTIRKSVTGDLKSLLEEGNKEIENLQRLKSSTFDNVVTVNPHMIESTSKIRGRPGLEHILMLAGKSGRIRDIINASRMTDFQTYRHLFYMVKMGIFRVEAKREAKVQLVTDSTADLPPSIIGERHIISLPISVSPGQKVWSGRSGRTSENSRQMLKISRTFPTSASPSVNDFHHLFRKIAPDKDVLAIFLSGKISRTFENALAAREKNFDDYLRQRQQKYLEEQTCRIEILDSRLVSLGLGMLVVEASDKIEEGWPVEKVRRHIEKLIPTVRIFFVIDTAGYLHQKGQMGRVRAMMGWLMGMKPILSIWNGEVTAIDQVRGGKSARQRVSELIRWSMDDSSLPLKIGIMHTDMPKWAAQMKELLESQLDCRDIMVSHVGASAGSYCGPGTVAVAYFPVPEE